MHKKICVQGLSLLLAFVMAFSLLPVSAFATESTVDVYVSVENTTFTSEEDGSYPLWSGVLLEPYKVSIPAGASVMDATAAAFEASGIIALGMESNYIYSIDGLASGNGSGQSGWMIAVNDWFINEGAGDIIAEDGDVVCWMFTLYGYGEDLGGSWNSNDKSLTALSFSAGELSPAFGPDVDQYTLTVPAGTDSLLVAPTAANKNFQVRTNVDGDRYKLMQPIPVENGTEISIVCGDPSWPTMNWGSDSIPAQSYTITVAVQRPPIEDPVTLPELSSDWNSTRGNRQNMGVVSAQTPRNAEEAALLWDVKYASGSWTSPNTPVIVDGNLIFAAGSKIYKVNKTTGEVLAQSNMLSAASFNISSVTYGGGMVFATIKNGQIQAFNAETLESLWVSEELGGQSLSHIIYADGYVYTGFWKSETAVSYYVGMSVTDEDSQSETEVKNVLWKHETPGGYYWTGGVVFGDYIIFGSDNGSSTTDKEAPSALYSLNRFTGEIADTCGGIIGDQRSCMAYDADTDAIYFTSKAGYVCKIKLDESTGKFIADSLIIRQMNPGWEATGTPTVYNGVLFVGTGAGVGGGGKMVAADAETLEILAFADLPGYPQGSPLLSSAYAQSEGKLYIYTTYNKTPGGLTVVEYDIPTKTLTASGLFTPPDGRQNYCIDSAICDTEGTIYYHNDSTYMFAIARTEPDTPEVTPPQPLITQVKASRTGMAIALTQQSDGKYTATVGNSYSSVDISVTAVNGAEVTINGQAQVNGTVTVALSAGTDNIITIAASKDEQTETVTIIITRKAAEPPSGGGEEEPSATVVGAVSITVRNETFPDGGLTGLLISEPAFEIIEGDTMMTALLRALKANGYSWTGTGGDGNGEDYKIAYLAGISKDGKSLSEFDGDAGSGWMGALNDFFVNEGFQQFSLEDGDEISIEYTQDLGADLGAGWNNPNTALRALGFSAGTLSPIFDSEAREYILTLPAGAKSVKVTPRVYNRNFLTKTFLNEKVTSNTEGVSFYRRTQYIPVKAGDTIYIGIGESAWPSMNNDGAVTATWYAVKINIEGSTTGNTELPPATEAIPQPETPLGGQTVVYNAPQAADGATEYTVSIPASELSTLNGKSVLINTAAGSITLPASLVGKLAKESQELIITVENSSLYLRATLGGKEIQPKDYGESIILRLPMDLSDNQNADMVVLAKIIDDGTTIVIGNSLYSLGFVTATVSETGKYDIIYNEKYFSDTAGKWMDKAVLYMASREIITGVGDGLYQPQRAITRAEFTALLVRSLEAMGVELDTADNSFADVYSDKWYAQAVLKARGAGLVSGVDDNRFAPDEDITRQDMFTMLYRAMDKFGLLDRYARSEAMKASDSDSISDYAQEAVEALTSRGIISGRGNGEIAPKDSSSRGECAQVLYNILSRG